jgi:hypothetical protein
MINLFSKDSINLYIFIFIVVIIILLNCFSFYYILPNIYDLYENKLILNIKPLKTLKIIIKPTEKCEIKLANIENLDNMLIQIKTKESNYPIKILINNFFKSQSLYIKENTLFKTSSDSFITILNNKDELSEIDLNFYSIEEVMHQT